MKRSPNTEGAYDLCYLPKPTDTKVWPVLDLYNQASREGARLAEDKAAAKERNDYANASVEVVQNNAEEKEVADKIIEKKRDVVSEEEMSSVDSKINVAVKKDAYCKSGLCCRGGC